MPSPLSSLSPADFGAPEKFSEWRPYQAEATERIVRSEERFVPLCAPPGVGKSVAYITAAMIAEKRAVVLTSTKGLQSQLTGDFKNCGLVDIRGKANYRCVEYPGCSCDEAAAKCGAAKVGGTGRGRGVGCRYREAYERACASPLVVTNYACWMHTRKAQRLAGKAGFCVTAKDWEGTPHVRNPVEMLILDEAHSAEKELSGFLHTEMGVREVQEVLGEGVEWFGGLTGESGLGEWREWAGEKLEELEGLEEEWKGEAQSEVDIKRLRRLSGLASKLEAIGGMPNQGWVVDEIRHRQYKSLMGFQFDPVWPAGHAESALFCGVPKVVLVSATLTTKGLGLLGVREDQYKFKEYPFIFDRKRCPIYWIPTVRLTPMAGVTEQDKRTWVRRIDRIIEMRLDRKGIVLVPSFHLQRYFLEHTEHKRICVYNDTSWGAGEELRTAPVVEGFLKARAPKVLVSPSVGTGYDFKGPSCEYLVIGKVPFPDMSSKVMQERRKRDPSYANHIAMQTLEQWTGRPMRYEQDQAECFVVDDGIGWFLRANSGLANGWFRGVVRRVDGAIPEPPPKL